MFSRRSPRPRRDALRNALWPRMGFRRLMKYYRHRLVRLQGTPRAVAAGMATGVAVSFTPFVGLHIAIGLAACWLLRANVVAMIIGTLVAGNPWTLGLSLLASYNAGHGILNLLAREGWHVAPPPADFSLATLWSDPVALFLPVAVGSVPLVVLSGLVVYVAVYRLVRRYRKR